MREKRRGEENRNNAGYGTDTGYGSNADYGNVSYYSSNGSYGAPGGTPGNGNAFGGRTASNGGAASGGSGKRPKKKKKRSRVGDVISMIVMAAAFCVFVYAGYTLYGYYKEYKKADDEYASLASYATGEDETEDLDEEAYEEAEEEGTLTQLLSGREVRTVTVAGEEVTLPVMESPIDFESLQAINSDIVGWLKIRALDLSYPVVQGEDNDYYLHRSFEQEELFAGCLFMHYENESDFSDQNTVIYGHNMKNGSMFGSLKKFRDEEVFQTSKYFWIYTEDVIYMYRIFSARVVDKVGQPYQIVFTDEEFEEFLTTAMEESEVSNTNVTVSTDDKVVTLSTCTGDSATRFVVQGKLTQMYAVKK